MLSSSSPSIPEYPTAEDIWNLADENNFEALIAALLRAGVNKNSTGEALFSFAKQAIVQKRLGSGRIILQFLIDFLEDQTEALPIIKIVGDLYKLEQNDVMARKYYSRLPMETGNISLYLQTFHPGADFDELLNARDQLLAQTPTGKHHKINGIVDEIVKSFVVASTGLMEEHKARYEKNLGFIGRIAPSLAENIISKHNFSGALSRSTEPYALKIADSFYGRLNGIWSKIFITPGSELNLDALENNESILIRCPTPASCLELINKLTTIEKDYYRYECFVVLNLQILFQVMLFCDLSPLEDCAFVMRFIDEHNLQNDLGKILLEEKAFFPAKLIDSSGSNLHYYEQVIQPLLKKFEKEVIAEIEVCRRKLAYLYPNDFYKKVIRKIRNGKKLSILFYSSRYTTYTQYSIRDMAAGFRMLGHKVLIEQEKERAGYGIRKDVTLRNLCNFRPDIIFTIDHLRYEMDYIPRSIPFITWVQDLLPNIIAIDNPALITDQDYIFSFSRRWVEKDFKNHIAYKNKDIHLLPVVVSSHIYKPLPNTMKIYDVTAVTHLGAPESTLYPFTKDERVEDFSYSEQKAIRKLVMKLDSLSLTQLRALQMSAVEREKLIIKICERTNIILTKKLRAIIGWSTKHKESTPFRNHIISLLKRHPVAHLLKNGINVKAFGNNWDKYANVRNAAMGEIKNGPELNRLFNQSRINLNASPGTTYHMKVPEVIASKNFMLTAHIPSSYDCMPIEFFFKKDKEVVLFKDEEDLMLKVDFYLNNVEEREKITSLAYKRFMAKYTNKAGALTILDDMITNRDNC